KKKSYNAWYYLGGLVLLCSLPVFGNAGEVPEVINYNGKIITLDKSNKIVEQEAIPNIIILPELKPGSMERTSPYRTGKYADMTVLSDDILTIDPEKIIDIKSLNTIVGGNIVFERK
ncbi:MAG: hypothetical protein WCK09_10635, partial [Bacteroidota bacterium]